MQIIEGGPTMQFRRELKTNPRVLFGPILGLSESFVVVLFLVGSNWSVIRYD